MGVSSVSLPFGPLDDDIGSESSPLPASPVPSVGSVKQGGVHLASSADSIFDDQGVLKVDDIHLDDLDNATRKLLTDVVVEFEKNRVRTDDGAECSSSRMVTPVNIPT